MQYRDEAEPALHFGNPSLKKSRATAMGDYIIGVWSVRRVRWYLTESRAVFNGVRQLPRTTPQPESGLVCFGLDMFAVDWT